MNQKALGASIQDLAASIAGYLKPQAGELHNTVAEMLKNNKQYQKTVAVEGMEAALTVAHVDEDVIKEITKNMKGKTYESAIDSVTKQVEAATDIPVKTILDKAKQKSGQILESASPDEALQEKNKFERYINYPQAYFNSPDFKTNAVRMGTAVGTYAGAAVGGRYLSGGTLTTDNYGQKNIAGIPFI